MNRRLILQILCLLAGLGALAVVLGPSEAVTAAGDSQQAGDSAAESETAAGDAAESEAAAGDAADSDVADSEAAAAVISSLPPVLVETAPAVTRPASGRLWAPGTLVSLNDARLAAELAGRLIEVAEVGDRLQAGDVVARLDDEALHLDLRARKAEILRLEARRAYLGKQLERFEALTEEHITARHQLDDLGSQRAMAEQDLEGARVERDRTLYLIERSTLRAPFRGRVVERLAQPGGFVARGEPVARLVAIDRVEARAQAPLRVAPFVREGLEVTVEAFGENHRGEIRAAVPVADERSRMFEIRVRLEGVHWAVGSPLRVSLPSDGEDGKVSAIAVPRDALVLRRGLTWVWVVEGDTARQVEVVTGGGSGELIRVTGDLAVGDLVVVRGGERLQPGQRVRVAGR